MIASERLGQESPMSGDARFHVNVDVSAFRSSNENVWIAAPALAAFVADAEVLERDRVGSATLESISPAAFCLELGVHGLARQIRARGYLNRRSIAPARCELRLSFEFEMDPWHVRELIECLRAGPRGGDAEHI